MAKWTGNRATWSLVCSNGASVLDYRSAVDAAPTRVDVGKGSPPRPAASRVISSGERSECQPAEIPCAKHLSG